MQIAIPVSLSLTLLILGLSYALHTPLWIRLFRSVLTHPQQLFLIGLLMLAMGVLVGYGYNDWTPTWPLFITSLGWLLALEGAVFLLLPGLVARMARLSDGFLAIYIRGGGLILMVLGGLSARHFVL